jgi:hypothetical protein
MDDMTTPDAGAISAIIQPLSLVESAAGTALH